MNEEISKAAADLEDKELLQRVSSGYYSDQALPVIIEEIKSRGLSVPKLGELPVENKIPFRKAHPIIFWILVAIAGNIIIKLIRNSGLL
jgi:hypothetical protein